MRILALIALLLPLSAHAETKEELELLGFSPDGAYFAFRAHAIEDGSGFPVSRVRIVDVKKNAFVGKEYRFIADSEKTKPEKAREESLALAKAALEKLGIDSKNPGKSVFVGKPKPGAAPRSPSVGGWGDSAESYEIRVESRPYPLSLKELQVICPQDGGEGNLEPKIVEVSVKNTKTGASRVLQKDSRLPVRRGCALAYHLGRVIRGPGRAVAVMVQVISPGYEGPDTDWMPVTGELP